MQKTARSLFSLVILGSVITAFVWFFQPARTPLNSLTLERATILSSPRTLQPFSLKQGNGKTFTDHNFQGKWSLVFFGYTHCPDICPITMKMLQEAKETYQKNGLNPQVVFVTLDPKADPPEQVGQWTQHFDSNFIGLTGALGQIKNLSAQFGITHVKNGQLIDHTGAVIVINPKGQYYAVFTTPSLKALKEDFVAMVKSYQTPV